MKFTDIQTKKIKEACHIFNVRNLYVFGSYTSSDFSEKSDVDFLVEFIRNGFSGAFDQYLEFKMKLESIMGRNVDLICIGSIRNPIFKNEVETTRETVYAA